MRIQDLGLAFQATAAKRTTPRHCEKPGCNQATRESKAFCVDHVDEHPYVQNLLNRLAEREVQDEAVTKRGAKAVAPDSITVQEILQHLEYHGNRTEERLCRELNLDARTMHGYIQGLKRLKIVILGTTKRGSTLVKLKKTG